MCLNWKEQRTGSLYSLGGGGGGGGGGNVCTGCRKQVSPRPR